MKVFLTTPILTCAWWMMCLRSENVNDEMLVDILGVLKLIFIFQFCPDSSNTFSKFCGNFPFCWVYFYRYRNLVIFLFRFVNYTCISVFKVAMYCSLIHLTVKLFCTQETWWGVLSIHISQFVCFKHQGQLKLILLSILKLLCCVQNYWNLNWHFTQNRCSSIF